MIDRKKLLADLQSLLRKEIEPDLRKRSDLPAIAAALKAEFDKAKKAKRTAMNYTDWRADTITQIGVAWVLSCVFIRFLEDNRLVDPPRLSGPTEAGETHSGLQRARDEYDLHIQSNPEHSFRQYILSVIDDLAKLPGGKEVFGKNNIIHQHRDWLSNDAAKSLYNFWQKIEPTTGDLVHNFTDDAEDGQPFDTRFLGDLYQDLSEAARKKYALLQTPDFVEAFILDRTLEPALDEFGLEPKPPEGSGLTTNTFRMIDPACGSGHFLLGAFDRILERWQRKEPGAKVDVLVERTLASIHGVDVNPFAVSIARFRLLLAAFRACHVTRLDQPIDFHINVACGDSLYHGKQKQGTLEGIETDESHYFQVENVDELRCILREGTYHAVVANPPYITPKDKAAKNAYKLLYPSCHRQYSYSIPFTERIFRLAIRGEIHGGYVGQITSNSFMKREFGTKLVEAFFPTVDLSHVIDTSLAFIPEHGTPTVIIFGRNRCPIDENIRCAMGIKREDGQPSIPRHGLVWSSATNHLDEVGFENAFVTIADLRRIELLRHPWTIGGGGVGDLKAKIDSIGDLTVAKITRCIGRIAHTGDDDAYVAPLESLRRSRINLSASSAFVEGDRIRDWSVNPGDYIVFPYTARLDTKHEDLNDPLFRWLWQYRRELWERREPNGAHYEIGKTWYEYSRFHPERYVDDGLALAFVGTHNHFAFDPGRKVFKQSAPVVKVKDARSEDDYYPLLSVLNSSLALFWLRQNCHDKGGGGIGGGIAAEAWERFFEFTGTVLQRFPLPSKLNGNKGKLITELTTDQYANSPFQILRATSALRIPERLSTARKLHCEIRLQMIRLQEDLDWECYGLYGLLKEDLTYRCEEAPGIKLGQRAFEIVMARKMAAGELETTWFERHGSTPITELPEEWPDDYKALVNRRIEVIESNPNIALIEQPEYKRRWNTEPWDSQVERALREWMLLRLESYFDFDGRMSEGLTQSREDAKEEKPAPSDLSVSAPLREIAIYSVAKLADVAFKDPQFREVAEVYRGRADFDPVKLIDELVADEHVPALPILRYKPSGLDKRAEWENTWRLQRIEDRIHAEVELICRDALTEDSAGAITPDQPLDPYKAILNVNKVDFKSLAEAVSRFEPTAQAAGVSTRSEPAADIVGSLKNGFAKSKLGTLVDLQRLVTHEILGDIPVPPKYTSGDFISTGGAKYWKLRGKLDVPKERWVSFPHCQGEDQTLPIAWAGYDHLQLLQAIAAYFAEVQQLGGSDDPRLVPLLAAMDQQIPWVKQWHNDTDNEYGYALGDFFEDFIATEARNLGLTLEDVRAWDPPAKSGGRTKKTSKA